MTGATTRLGFGCSSLGSRIGRRDSLAALARAHEAGVTWFDIAPSYGDGQAEEIFREFARGRAGTLKICTKVGRTPPTVGGAAALLRRLGRPLAAASPHLRRLAGRGRAPANRLALDAQAVHQSLDASLRRLGLEQVECLALHDPRIEDLGREEIRRALEDVVVSGKARRVGVAGAYACSLEGARTPVYSHFQFAARAGAEAVADLRPLLAPDALIVTHSVSRILRPSNGLAAGRLAQDLRRLGYVGAAPAVRYAAALDLALASNTQGVVLASMVTKAHLTANVSRAEAAERAPIAELRECLAAAEDVVCG